jgi:hypothetical protein
MAGDEAVAKWIVNKLKGDVEFSMIEPMGSGFFRMAATNCTPFTAVAIGVPGLVNTEHVVPLFNVEGKLPEFVVNVPSKAIWSGAAIEFVHDAPAAFGTFGDLIRASRGEPVAAYRNKGYGYFERAFRQHTAVLHTSRLYDRVFQLHRDRGLPDIIVVLINAYDLSAEDVRHARDLYGTFDAVVKMNSYGSITTAAAEAAEAIGAEAFTLRELMGRLNKR